MSDDRLLQGVGVSPGCVVANAYVIPWGLPDVPHRVVPVDAVDSEIERLRAAIESVKRHLAGLRDRTRERAGPEEAKIFEAQMMMLDDPELMGAVEDLIRKNQLSAERAFEFQALELRALWATSENPILRQRRADILGIGVRLLQRLLGASFAETLEEHRGRPIIVVTRELTPDLTVEFEDSAVVGLASVEGTRTSHAAILAHSLGIPCVMGFREGIERIVSGQQIILDGNRGTILIAPTEAEVAEALRSEEQRQIMIREFLAAEAGPTSTPDGSRVALRGNLDRPEELDQVIDQAAEGVGLLRTEFLVIGRAELPSEEEQASYFTRVADRFAGHPVVIRSYDLGGDKFPAPFRPPREPNPFLGWRAIRVCLDQPEIFRPQIRAALRARAAGDIQLMLPLVTQLEEVRRTREFIDETAHALARQGLEHRADLPLGAMIETPAAGLIVAELAAESDFLSVGTNDLTQYTLAVDRANAALADRFSSFHPAVVRMLKHIADVTNDAGRPASICGEMASEPLAVLLLLGLGYRVFSVAPPQLSLLRWLVRQIDAARASTVVEAALEAKTTQEVTALLLEGMEGMVDVALLSAWQLPDPLAPTSLQF